MKGWEIKCKENIEKFTSVANCVVGVLGEVNSGKTFILNKIGGTNLRYQRTKGISVFFPKENNNSKGFCFLDTPGFGQDIPLQEASDEKRIIELNRDRILTENLINEIVLSYSNIIILVISQLNFDAQIYLNKIKKTVKNKTLFVIHNLSSAQSEEEVKQYINNYLKKSKTFNVLKENMLEIKEQGEDIFDSYFKEPKPITDNKNIQHHNDDDDDDDEEEEEEKNEVLHFLMMNDNVNDSKYYNTAPIKYLRNQIICCSSKVPFHPLNALKDTLNKIFKDNGREDLYGFLKTFNNTNENNKVIALGKPEPPEISETPKKSEQSQKEKSVEKKLHKGEPSTEKKLHKDELSAKKKLHRGEPLLKKKIHNEETSVKEESSTKKKLHNVKPSLKKKLHNEETSLKKKLHNDETSLKKMHNVEPLVKKKKHNVEPSHKKKIIDETSPKKKLLKDKTSVKKIHKDEPSLKRTVKSHNSLAVSILKKKAIIPKTPKKKDVLSKPLKTSKPSKHTRSHSLPNKPIFKRKKRPKIQPSKHTRSYSLPNKPIFKEKTKPKIQSSKHRECHPPPSKPIFKEKAKPKIQITKPKECYSLQNKTILKRKTKPKIQISKHRKCYSLPNKPIFKEKTKPKTQITKHKGCYSLPNKPIFKRKTKPENQMSKYKVEPPHKERLIKCTGKINIFTNPNKPNSIIKQKKKERKIIFARMQKKLI